MDSSCVVFFNHPCARRQKTDKSDTLRVDRTRPGPGEKRTTATFLLTVVGKL